MYIISIFHSVSVREDVSSFPYNLWQLRYTDTDSDPINRESTYHLISLMNGSTPIGNNITTLIFIIYHTVYRLSIDTS